MLLFLIFKLILVCQLSSSPVILPTEIGPFMKDLYFWGPDMGSELAKKWVINGTANETQVKWSTCNYDLFGGINITPAGSSVSRTYSNLPAHGIVFYTLWLTTIDGWQPGQKIYFSFDNRVVASYEHSLYVGTEGSARCGTSVPDTFVKIYGTAYHSSSSVTFGMTTDTNSASSGAAFAMSDFRALVRNQGSFTESTCVRVFIASSSVPGTCACSDNQYYDATDGCVSCDPSCDGCFGPSAAECHVCQGFYFYDTSTGKCTPCTTHCLVCSGAAANQCELCHAANLTLSGTCESTCPSGTIHQKLAFDFCTCPIGQYPDSSTACVACPIECSDCTSAPVCTSCNSGTSLVNGQCQCPSGKYYIQGSGCTGTCSQGCSKCTNDTVCTECYSGPTLTSGQCLCPSGAFYIEDSGCSGTCSQGCNRCVNETTCTQCYSGPSLVSGQCQCLSGIYYIQGSGCAGTCSQGCNRCTNDTVCTECYSYPGLSLTSGQCQCSSGTFYIEGSGCTGTCSQGCNRCTNDTVCTECYSGPSLTSGQCLCPSGAFYIEDSGCSGTCSQGCNRCVNETTCTQCYSGPSLISGHCECPQRKYYEDGTGCTGQCSLGCYTCANSSVCQTCASQTSLQSGGYCQCNAVGFFYVENQDDCVGTCPTYCDYCNNATVCITCKTGMVWQDSRCQCPSPKLLMDDTCHCPTGTFENPQTFLCDSTISLDISYQSKVSPYANLILQAQMSPEEDASFVPVFEWNFYSNTANTTLLAALGGYLSSQTNKNVMVPSSYLEPSTVYTVKANYSNAQNQAVSKSVLIETTGIELQVSIKGGSLQTLDYSAINTIAAEVVSPTGPVSSSLLDITWSQTGDNLLTLAPLISSQKPLLLSLPKCTLTLGKSYNFTVSAKQKGTTNTPTTAQLNITSPKPQLTVNIPNGNRAQKANENLLLNPILGVEDNCNLTTVNTLFNISSRQAIWECSKVDSQGTSSLCDDPDSIFSPPQGVSFLTVPSSYFSQNIGDELIFKLRITVKSLSSTDLFSANTQTSFTISAPDATSVSLSQTSPNLYTVATDNSTQHNYTYSWDLPPEVQYVFFSPKLKILIDMSTLAPLTSVRSKLIVTDELGHTTSLYYQLLINQAPRPGILTVSPASGTSLVTDFVASASGWLDDDIPFTYQFFYTQNQSDSYKSLTSLQLNSYTSTKLVSSSSQGPVYVKVIVTDNLGAANSTYLGVSVQPSTNIIEATSQIQQLLSQKSDLTPSELNNLLTLATDTLNSIETMYTTTDACPLCSGHGQCLNSNQCTCQVGYTLADCSMLLSLYNSLMNTKADILDVMQEAVSSIAVDTAAKDAVSQTLEALSASPIFNNVQTLTSIQNIIESALNLNSSQTVLTTSQSIDLSNILSNMLTYASQTDSSLDGQFSQNLEAKANQYLSTVSDSLLANMLPGEDPVVITTPNFGMYVAKSTPCTLSSQNITISPDYPTLQVFSNDTENCSTSLDVKYYAINASLFGSSGDPDKVVIALDVRNSETKEQLQGLSVKVIPTGNQECPVDCERSQGECLCAGMFDIKGQLAKVFKKSNIGKLGNIDALAGFKFWQSLAVWSAIGFTTWFLISLYFVKVQMPGYTITEKIRTKKKALIPKIKKSRILLLIAHPVLSIYFYNDLQLSKVTKLILYYQQVIFLLTYTALFPAVSEENQIVSKIILIIIKSITITPLMILITWLIKDLDPNEKTPITWFRKNKRVFGIILSALCTTGCLYIIVIVSAQAAPSSQVEWTINFLVVLVQDLLLSPPIALAIQVVLILYMASKLSVKILFLKSIFSRAISKDTEKLYIEVYVDKKTLAGTLLGATMTPGMAPIKLPSPKIEPITLQKMPMEFLTPMDSPTQKTYKRTISLSENKMSRRQSEKGSIDITQAQQINLFPDKTPDSPLAGGETTDRLFAVESPFRSRRISRFGDLAGRKKTSNDIL